MRTRLILALALLALLAAACGGDDGGLLTTTTAGSGTTAGATETTGGQSGSIPACTDLLSLEEVAAVFGMPAVFDPEGSSADNMRAACSWASEATPDSIETQLLFVQVYVGAEYYGPEILYPEAESVSGIGDKAFVNLTPASVATGTVDGDMSMFVDYSIILGSDSDAASKKDQVLNLLRLVHDRVL